jgi:hypothetical protein
LLRQLNQIQDKRFINNIIIANQVFTKRDKHIEIDALIAVQALNFRPTWNRFLELISEKSTRDTFFGKYYIPSEGRSGKSITNKDELNSFIKEQRDAKNPLPKEIIDIFEELIIKQNDDTLKNFLDDAGADKILQRIGELEDYRRALAATKVPKEEELKALSRVERLIFEWIRRFTEDNTIPLTEIISFETEFMSSIDQWFGNMINKEDRLYYSPVREIARTNLRDQIDVLRKANEMQTTPTAESKEIILKNQKQIAETLRKIDGKMPP